MLKTIDIENDKERNVQDSMGVRNWNTEDVQNFISYKCDLSKYANR